MAFAPLLKRLAASIGKQKGTTALQGTKAPVG
jgi:hypothetical protein